MIFPRKPELTTRQQERLERLHKRFQKESLPPDLGDIISERLSVDLHTSVGGVLIENPFVVASGDVSRTVQQVEKAVFAGWGAVVLKSAAAEDERKNCTFADRRKPPVPVRSDYLSGDTHREYPRVRWDGSLDERALYEYLLFARQLQSLPAPIIPSFAFGSWPELDYTTQALASAGFITCEAADLPDVYEELEQLPITVLKKSTLQGISTGKDALMHLIDGSTTAPVYSLLAGKVHRVAKQSMNKFEQVLYKLLLDPKDGLVAWLVHVKNIQGVSRVVDLPAIRETTA